MLSHVTEFVADPVTPELFGQWVSRNPFDTEGRTVTELREVIGELRSAHGITSLGAQGFCWGGFYAVHLTSLPGDLVSIDEIYSVTAPEVCIG